MNKLLVISGPTATGKTDLAVTAAKKFNGELISADSRQIYQGMDIGVGKDHPEGTPIHLIDLITPDRIFSVAEFQKLALTKIDELQKLNKLPIIVGCSGFYLDSVINPGYDTFAVKPNKILRDLLNIFPLWLLKFTLQTFDFQTFRNLNNSDINNPRRLIRKIELKISNNNKNNSVKNNFDILHISLTASNKFIYNRIDERVQSRLKIGHLKELEKLLKQYSWNDPGLKVAAYRVFKPYFEKRSDLADAINKWQFAEHAEARRQKTWLKRYGDAKFFDISKKNWQLKADKLLVNWYNKL